jgi:glutathionylspermidine synthase
MHRERGEPRADWPARVEAFGFDFHTIDGQPYWVDDGCYRFDAEEIDRIEDAGNALHQLCLEAVDRICTKGDFDRVGLSGLAAELAEKSWQRRENGLLGRMDLAYDGRGEPKLLEYNADTPTSLLEASVIQWYWLEETLAGGDQFNRIHEALVARWPKVANRSERMHFAGALESMEDRGNLAYLRETCIEAGFDTQLVDISEIGMRGGQFFDLEDKPIRQLDKLYPWEWLVTEPFGAAIPGAKTRWIEPAWKQVLSNKRLLPLLWEMFPGHPNLLPAALDPSRLRGPVARKPQFGREGENVTLHADASHVLAAPGFVVQGYAPMYESECGHALLGLWIVGDEAVGMGVREDDQAVTTNTSRFVPHCFDA